MMQPSRFFLPLPVEALLEVSTQSFSPNSFSYKVLTSSIGVRVRRFFGFVLGRLSGRVSSEVPSDVCMGAGSQIEGGLSGLRCRLMCVWVRSRGWLSGCVWVRVRRSREVCMGEGGRSRGWLSGRVMRV